MFCYEFFINQSEMCDMLGWECGSWVNFSTGYIRVREEEVLSMPGTLLQD